MGDPQTPVHRPQASSLSSSSVDPQRVLQLWRSPDQLKRPTASLSASASSGSTDAQRSVQQLAAHVEQLQARVASVDGEAEKQRDLVEDLQARLHAAESDLGRLRADLEAAYRQLEADASALERERGQSLDMAEQLRYLSGKVSVWREEQLTPVQASYWALAAWVYLPLLHLVRGLWVVLSPVATTFQRLTLLGFEPGDTEEDELYRWIDGGEEPSGSASGGGIMRQQAPSVDGCTRPSGGAEGSGGAGHYGGGGGAAGQAAAVSTSRGGQQLNDGLLLRQGQLLDRLTSESMLQTVLSSKPKR